MRLISVVIPCYNEQESVTLFYQEIIKVAVNIQEAEFEFVFVDDGSKDNTIRIIKDLEQKDNRIKYISFSRNFGKEAAIYAGLENAKGDYVVLIDVDLQHPPQIIEQMYYVLAKEGYDCAATCRVNRKGEPPIRSFLAKMFYKVINRFSELELVDGAQDFRMMTRQVVNKILSVTEYNRFSKGIFSWVGFQTKWIECENQKRLTGKSKWSFWKLFNYSIDALVSFSTTPLMISSLVGVLCCILSFIYICFIIVRTLIFGDPVAGFPTLICAVFFMGGLQLFFLGVLGQYLARTYMETKKRPIYIAKENNIF